MVLERKPIEWTFWPKWVIASVVGILAGYAVAATAVYVVLFDILGDRVLLLPSMPLFGAIIWSMFGFSQWVLMRRYFDVASWWIWSTSIGGSVGLTIFSAFSGGSGFVLPLASFGILLGGIVGFGQWLVLRQYIDRADWWIVASLSTGVLFWAIHMGRYSVNLPLAFAVYGFIHGGFTGASMIWLLRNPKSKLESTPDL